MNLQFAESGPPPEPDPFDTSQFSPTHERHNVDQQLQVQTRYYSHAAGNVNVYSNLDVHGQPRYGINAAQQPSPNYSQHHFSHDDAQLLHSPTHRPDREFVIAELEKTLGRKEARTNMNEARETEKQVLIPALRPPPPNLKKQLPTSPSKSQPSNLLESPQHETAVQPFENELSQQLGQIWLEHQGSSGPNSPQQRYDQPDAGETGTRTEWERQGEDSNEMCQLWPPPASSIQTPTSDGSELVQLWPPPESSIQTPVHPSGTWQPDHYSQGSSWREQPRVEPSWNETHTDARSHSQSWNVQPSSSVSQFVPNVDMYSSILPRDPWVSPADPIRSSVPSLPTWTASEEDVPRKTATLPPPSQLSTKERHSLVNSTCPTISQAFFKSTTPRHPPLVGLSGELRSKKLSLLAAEVPAADEDERISALEATGWDVPAAARRVKLDRLLRLGVASRAACEVALVRANWNLDAAASAVLDGGA